MMLDTCRGVGAGASTRMRHVNDHLDESPDESDARLHPAARRLVAVGFGLSGAAALIYEVTWTRELSLVFSSTVYAVSIMLAAFMSGLSLGGLLGGLRADREGGDIVKDLATVEMGIAITGIASPLTFHLLPQLQFQILKLIQPAPMVFFFIQMALAFVVMLVPTTLMGMTFPLASKMSATTYHRLGRIVGGLYSVNTMGSIAGSLISGFVLIPLIGVRATIMVAGLLNLIVSATIMAASRRPAIYRIGVALAIALALALIQLVNPSDAVPLSLGTAYRFSDMNAFRAAGEEGVRSIWSEENSYSRVSVFESVDGDFRFLVNGSLVEGSNGEMDDPTASMSSLLPIAYTAVPDSILVVGLGTGKTTRAALSTPARSVTTVEINPAMADAARYFVGDELENDPRWTMIESDARQTLLLDTTEYDVITSEPSWPLADAVAPLFTREFFEIARSRLKPSGTYCQWLPEYLLNDEDQAMMVRTFHSVYPDMHVWKMDVGGASNGDLLLVGHSESQHEPSAVVAQRLVDALAAQGITGATPYEVPLSEFVGTSLGAWKGTMNTDDRPLLEFDVPKTLVLMGEGLR